MFKFKLLLISLLAANSVVHLSAKSTAESIVVSVDLSKTQKEINPFIYAQFIEHLGRCIYGGIWAEMLEDRKFYFPITKDYDPYKSLTDTPFPVVGASPWEIVGDADGVKMVEEDSFVGDHTPKIKPGSGIRQHDLAVVKDKGYDGSIWLKAVGDDSAKVTVALETSDGKKHELKEVTVDSSDYAKHKFNFQAEESSEKAKLMVSVEGDGSVLVGTLSLMPSDNVRGMRADTLELLKKLNSPMYRWPGGNFVSGYDWRDGIGPRDRRPPRKNPAWTGIEHNDMGTDEFLDFCRELDSEPLIAVNTGFGDDYSAAQWVEYANSSTDTIGGGWRADNGQEEPYNVKYWCVGNEMFGPWQLGFMQVSHYTQKHNLVAKAMRKVDSSIELIGVGDLGKFNREHDPDQKYGWTETMLRECADTMEYISEHFYRGRVPWTEEGRAETIKHVGMLRESIREKVEGHRELQKRLGLLPDNLIPIAMDEWNYWHRDYVYGELGCRYDVADGLGVAAGLHEYFRSTDIVDMAHYAQTVNVIGCIKTTKTEAFFESTAWPLMLYREHFGQVPVAVECDREEEKLDVVAAKTSDGKTLTLGAVNPTDEAVTIEVKVDGGSLGSSGKQWVVSGDDPQAYNTEVEMRIEPKASEVDFDGKWEIPALSFAILRVSLDEDE